MVDSHGNESENRYQQLIKTSPAPINLFDESGEIRWSNDALVELLGFESRTELRGRSILEFIAPEFHETAKAELQRVVEEKTSTGPTAMELHLPDGETRSILVSTAPGEYAGQDIGQAVIIDVTERQRVQAELEREREFIEDALDTIQDVFYVVAPDGTLTRWNDELRKRSGYSDDELDGKDIEAFFVAEDTARISESIATALAEGSDVVEATVSTKHGNEVPYEFRKRRLTDGDDVVGVVGIGRDMSDRTIRDQHIRTIDHLLKHNLRNQVNVIQAASSLLESSTTDTDRVQFQRIEAATERLLSIFQDHHHIVRLLTAEPSPERIDVASLLDKLVPRLQEDHPDATISVTSPESAVVTAVPLLDRAIADLVEQAIQHTETAAPTVEIVVRADESTVSIDVRDDGAAIPEIEYESLAEGDRLSPTFHPTELALWFVYLVVRTSGGSLSVDRTAAEGNVVTLELRRAGKT